MSAPEVWMIRDGSILGVQSARGDIQEGKPFGCNACEYLRCDTAPWPRFSDSQETPGSGDTGEDGVGIERFDRPQVDDFHLVAFSGEFLGHGEAFVDHRA